MLKDQDRHIQEAVRRARLDKAKARKAQGQLSATSLFVSGRWLIERRGTAWDCGKWCGDCHFIGAWASRSYWMGGKVSVYEWTWELLQVSTIPGAQVSVVQWSHAVICSFNTVWCLWMCECKVLANGFILVGGNRAGINLLIRICNSS